MGTVVGAADVIAVVAVAVVAVVVIGALVVVVVVVEVIITQVPDWQIPVPDKHEAPVIAGPGKHEPLAHTPTE